MERLTSSLTFPIGSLFAEGVMVVSVFLNPSARVYDNGEHQLFATFLPGPGMQAYDR